MAIRHFGFGHGDGWRILWHWGWKSALIVFSLVLCSPSFAQTVSAGRTILPGPTLPQAAYYRFLSAFWEQSGAHLNRQFRTNDDTPTQGNLWEYAQGFNALYSYWKLTGDPDAQSKLSAHWTWTKSNWSQVQATACGVGTANVAQDDSAWAAGMFLQAYDVTADATALTYAKGILDCAWSRWQDNTTGGGLWYNDSEVNKSSYQGPYALVSYLYYKASGDTTYRTRAISIDTWASTVLAMTGAQSGLYWCNVDNTGTGVGSPSQIALANSSTLLAGNMAFATLDALLYADTGTASYLSRVQATAAAIKSLETVTGNILLDDRDAATNAWASYYYRLYVPPLLSSGADQQTLRQTGISVAANDIASDGTLGGDWQGPINGVWSATMSNDLLKISAQGFNLIATGLQ